MSGAEPTPNILLILSDQQRADALGAASPWMRTPALDRLAREGTFFRRCITQSPGCIPARVSLFTGLYPHNTGVWHVRPFALPATTRNWVRAVNAAGYRTSMIGKTHLHPHEGDLRDRRPLVESWGFSDVTETTGPRASARARSDMTDEWERLGLWDAFREDIKARTGHERFVVRPSPLGFEHHYDSFVGRRAVEQIRAYDPVYPWMCWVGFGGPHEPWDAPEPYARMYEAAAIPPPLPAMESTEPARPRGVLLDDRIETDAERLAGLGDDDLAKVRAGYAAKVSLIDHWVGELLAAVEERGELERTVVVFASDHGEMNGDHGLVHKSCFFEGAVTVPLVIRAPEGLAPRGRVVDGPVQLMDVGPTVAEAAGATLDYTQWGHSLWPLVRGETSAIRDFVVSEQRGEVMLSGQGWKVAVNQAGEAYLCTDLAGDPDELVNLAGSDRAAALTREGRDLLLAFLLETQLFDDWA